MRNKKVTAAIEAAAATELASNPQFITEYRELISATAKHLARKMHGKELNAQTKRERAQMTERIRRAELRLAKASMALGLSPLAALRALAFWNWIGDTVDYANKIAAKPRQKPAQRAKRP